MKRTYIFLPLISALVLIFASCGDKYFTNDGSAWGTTYHIVYSSSVDLCDSVTAVMDSVDRELSLFNPDSEVSAVNDGRTDSVGVGFTTVFRCAESIHSLSGGMFDPTVAPVAGLWGFGASDGSTDPDSAAIAEALSAVGLGSCSVENGIVSKKTPATTFDFSALAKGYGVDRIAAMLARNGCRNYMVEVGGEIKACGINPNGNFWRIQIDAPAETPGHVPFTVVELGPETQALASSGNYRNFRIGQDGKRYGHTISPLNGYPIQTATLAATVSASDCMSADALATACMCVEPAQAIELLGRAGAKGMIIVAVGDSLSMLSTPQFP